MKLIYIKLNHLHRLLINFRIRINDHRLRGNSDLLDNRLALHRLRDLHWNLILSEHILPKAACQATAAREDNSAHQQRNTNADLGKSCAHWLPLQAHGQLTCHTSDLAETDLSFDTVVAIPRDT